MVNLLQAFLIFLMKIGSKKIRLSFLKFSLKKTETFESNN